MVRRQISKPPTEVGSKLWSAKPKVLEEMKRRFIKVSDKKFRAWFSPSKKVLVFDMTVDNNQPTWRSGGELSWRATRQGITNRKLIKTMSEGMVLLVSELRSPFFTSSDW